MSSPITTHVLDTALGRPAAGLPVTLERAETPGAYQKVGEGVTDADGRNRALLPAGPLAPGDYRLTFAVAGYFKGQNRPAFYRAIPIEFTVAPGAGAQHYHVPLLLSPFGYSTYRGS